MHLQHLHLSEFFNVGVVEELFDIEVVDEFFNVEVVELFVEAGQFGFVASVRRVVGKLFVEAEQFVMSEFFNVKVVEELFCVEVVEEVSVFAAIRLLLRGCRAPFTFFKASRLKTSLCTYLNETFPLSSCS